MALCSEFLTSAAVKPTRLLTQRKSGIRTGRQAPTAFACTVTPEPDEVERPDWRPSCRHSNVREGRLAVLAHTAGGNTLVHGHKLAAAAPCTATPSRTPATGGLSALIVVLWYFWGMGLCTQASNARRAESTRREMCSRQDQPRDTGREGMRADLLAHGAVAGRSPRGAAL
jgi:hypothetical protein